MNDKMHPFVKWVGGKRQIINELISNMPKKYNKYYEPFVGGGALLFHLQPKSAVISDINKELMITYQEIKTNYDILKEYLLLMEYGHNKDFYLKVRRIDRNDESDDRIISIKNASNSMIAARFIYLNKACFNGMYRINSNGYFNVPWGQKEKVITHEYPNIKLISKYLTENKIQIKNESFEKVVKNVKKNDFVYFDPPYDYEISVNGFDSYTKKAFGREGQIKLFEECKKIDKKGGFFMVSNNDTRFIRDLYKDYKIVQIKAKRMINSDKNGRGKINELIIKNY